LREKVIWVEDDQFKFRIDDACFPSVTQMMNGLYVDTDVILVYIVTNRMKNTESLFRYQHNRWAGGREHDAPLAH